MEEAEKNHVMIEAKDRKGNRKGKRNERRRNLRKR
jgi:hypothetical protein